MLIPVKIALAVSRHGKDRHAAEQLRHANKVFVGPFVAVWLFTGVSQVAEVDCKVGPLCPNLLGKPVVDMGPGFRVADHGEAKGFSRCDRRLEGQDAAVDCAPSALAVTR